MAREAKEAEEKSGSKKPGKSHGFAAQHPFFLFLTDIISALFCSHHRCLLKIVRDDISKLPGCVQLLVRRGWLPKCGTESKVKTCGLFYIFGNCFKKLDFLTSCEVAPERRDLPETKRIRRKRLSLNFECICFQFTLSWK